MILRALRGFAAFWFDFIVGDDWRIAAGVALLLAGGAALVHGEVVRTDVIAIVLPLLIVGLVAVSILHDARHMDAELTAPADTPDTAPRHSPDIHDPY
jgi:hypothetical protein